MSAPFLNRDQTLTPYELDVDSRSNRTHLTGRKSPLDVTHPSALHIPHWLHWVSFPHGLWSLPFTFFSQLVRETGTRNELERHIDLVVKFALMRMTVLAQDV